MKLNFANRFESDKKGYLIIIGGAEDRHQEKYVLANVVKLSKASRIAVIPSASAYAGGLGDDYLNAFIDLGVQEVKVLDIRTANEADNPEYFAIIDHSDLVFFTGGDQVRLFDIMGHSELLNRIKERHLYNGLSIAGTSAGAAIVSDPMIYDGNQYGLYKGSVHFSSGFGLLPGITVDTHFVARGRIGRLTQFLCTGISQRGIGLGENTGLFIAPDMTAMVFGSGMVTVVSTENVRFSNFNDIHEGMPISIQGIDTGFLQDGCGFDLIKWKITHCNNEDSYSAKTRKEEVLKPQ